MSKSPVIHTQGPVNNKNVLRWIRIEITSSTPKGQKMFAAERTETAGRDAWEMI
jgi:hypothetical protein